MNRMRILVAGAALAIAAAAYAQTGDHNDSRNKHEHSGGASQGSGYGASSYGQSGGYGQSSGYGYGQGSSGYGQSYGQSSGTGPHDADHGDRSAQSGGAGGGGDRWTAGDWVVDGRWERNDNHYSLTATAPPDELHGPDLFLRCRDGHFDLSLIGDSDPPHYRGLYSMMVMTDRSAPGIVLRVTRGDPEWIGESTVLATSAEYPLSNATQIYVRLRYERGGTRDYTYNFKDLQSGKQQLYNVCKPPPASQPLVLNQILPGQWQVQIQFPFPPGVNGQLRVEMLANGMFNGQLMTPLGLTTVQGQWQANPLTSQIGLQGMQTNGFQTMPYIVMVQVNYFDPQRITAELVSNGGAFGGKEDMANQAQTALAAFLLDAPVKCTLSREESLLIHAQNINSGEFPDGIGHGDSFERTFKINQLFPYHTLHKFSFFCFVDGKNRS